MYMKGDTDNLQLQATLSNDTHVESFTKATMPKVTIEIWHLLVVTVSGNEFKLYYDGCKVSSTPVILQGTSPAKDFTLGCKPEGDNCPRNHYDNFLFWKIVKSPRFINWLWQN